MERLVELTPHLSGADRLRAFQSLPRGMQRRCLDDAATKVAFVTERQRRGLDLAPWDDGGLNILRSARSRQKAKKPTGPYRPPQTDDLDAIEAEVYVQAISGRIYEPTRHGYIPCPFPDHADSHPSMKLYEDSFYCFSCNRGGSIYTFAALYWGYPVPTRGEQFKELKARLRSLFA